MHASEVEGLWKEGRKEEGKAVKKLGHWANQSVAWACNIWSMI